MSEPFEMNATWVKPEIPCSCGSSNWWQRRDGVYICSTCHPSPDVIEEAGFRKIYKLNLTPSKGSK
jgi:hypothetical protein